MLYKTENKPNHNIGLLVDGLQNELINTSKMS